MHEEKQFCSPNWINYFLLYLILLIEIYILDDTKSYSLYFGVILVLFVSLWLLLLIWNFLPGYSSLRLKISLENMQVFL